MFVQLVVGTTSDGDGLRRQWERWLVELAPGATGWLGATGGVTSDGRAILAVRFADRSASAANSSRPEQAAWWSATEAHFSGPVTFLETDEVTVYEAGDLDAAGFVQVMRATVRDRARFEAVEAEMGPRFMELRPDFVGSYRAWFPDGTVAAVGYFRSESEARAGEAKEMPDDLKTAFQEWSSLLDSVEWYDLTQPWLAAPQ